MLTGQFMLYRHESAKKTDRPAAGAAWVLPRSLC